MVCQRSGWKFVFRSRTDSSNCSILSLYQALCSIHFSIFVLGLHRVFGPMDNLLLVWLSFLRTFVDHTSVTVQSSCLQRHWNCTFVPAALLFENEFSKKLLHTDVCWASTALDICIRQNADKVSFPTIPNSTTTMLMQRSSYMNLGTCESYSLLLWGIWLCGSNSMNTMYQS